MAQQLVFKTWSDSNVYTKNFKMTSNYTDLVSPDGKSSIIGVICNIIIENESTSVSHVKEFGFLSEDILTFIDLIFLIFL